MAATDAAARICFEEVVFIQILYNPARSN